MSWRQQWRPRPCPKTQNSDAPVPRATAATAASKALTPRHPFPMRSPHGPALPLGTAATPRLPHRLPHSRPGDATTPHSQTNRDCRHGAARVSASRPATHRPVRAFRGVAGPLQQQLPARYFWGMMLPRRSRQPVLYTGPQQLCPALPKSTASRVPPRFRIALLCPALPKSTAPRVLPRFRIALWPARARLSQPRAGRPSPSPCRPPRPRATLCATNATRSRSARHRARKNRPTAPTWPTRHPKTATQYATKGRQKSLSSRPTAPTTPTPETQAERNTPRPPLFPGPA